MCKNIYTLRWVRGNIRTASDILVAAQRTGQSRPSPQEPTEVCPEGCKQGMPYSPLHFEVNESISRDPLRACPVVRSGCSGSSALSPGHPCPANYSHGVRTARARRPMRPPRLPSCVLCILRYPKEPSFSFPFSPPFIMVGHDHTGFRTLHTHRRMVSLAGKSLLLFFSGVSGFSPLTCSSAFVFPQRFLGAFQSTFLLQATPCAFVWSVLTERLFLCDLCLLSHFILLFSLFFQSFGVWSILTIPILLLIHKYALLSFLAPP